MKFPTLRNLALIAALTHTPFCLGQVPGGPGDLSPHIDIGVDADTGQLQLAFTDIEAGVPIVVDNFLNSVPGGGGGFTNIPFSADQDVAYRTASSSIAADGGFSSFLDFGQSSPQIAVEAVELDPLFRAFAFPSSLIDEPGDSVILNAAGQFIDFHPTYFFPTDDPGFIGRAEGLFRLVPLTSTDVFTPSDSFELIFVVGGDFDDDSRLTDDDIALLEAAIDMSSTDPQFDLNRDDNVDDFDLDFFFTVLLEQPLPGLIGDYDGDGFVGQSDLDLVLLNFGSAELPEGFDVNGLPDTPGFDGFDGLIGQNELDAVLLNFGGGSLPGLSAVPEPGVASLIVFGGVAGLRRRR